MSPTWFTVVGQQLFLPRTLHHHHVLLSFWRLTVYENPSLENIFLFPRLEPCWSIWYVVGHTGLRLLVGRRLSCRRESLPGNGQVFEQICCWCQGWCLNHHRCLSSWLPSVLVFTVRCYGLYQNHCHLKGAVYGQIGLEKAVVVVCLEKAVGKRECAGWMVMKLGRRSVALRELSLLMLDLQDWLVIRPMIWTCQSVSIILVA